MLIGLQLVKSELVKVWLGAEGRAEVQEHVIEKLKKVTKLNTKLNCLPAY